MSLVTIAIVGKDNEPLYLRDFNIHDATITQRSIITSNQSSTSNFDDSEDKTTRDGVSAEQSPPEQQQQQQQEEGEKGNMNTKNVVNEDVNNDDDDDPFGFFTETLSLNESSSMRHQFIVHAAIDRFEEITRSGQWRKPGAVGSDALWVGLLCPIEECRVYGFLTNTNIKLMAIIEADQGAKIPPSRESDLKTLFATLHDLYVQYTLNPFTKSKEKISSRRFDQGVEACVISFNSKLTSKSAVVRR